MNEQSKTLILFLFISVLLMGLTVWNMTLNYKAIDIANEAFRQAGMGHPEFFTLVQAENDQKAHDLRHRRENAAQRREIEQQTRLVNLQLSSKIDKIPKPPQALQTLCDEMEKRILKLEVEVKAGRS